MPSRKSFTPLLLMSLGVFYLLIPAVTQTIPKGNAITVEVSKVLTRRSRFGFRVGNYLSSLSNPSSSYVGYVSRRQNPPSPGTATNSEWRMG
jgi:hypothetical protein